MLQLSVSKKFTLAFKISLTVKTKQKENENHNQKYIMQYKILISLLRNYVFLWVAARARAVSG